MRPSEVVISQIVDELDTYFPAGPRQATHGDAKLNRLGLIDELIRDYERMRAERLPVARDDRPALFELVAEALAMGAASPRKLIDRALPDGPIPARLRAAVADVVFTILSVAEQVGQAYHAEVSR